MMPKEVEDSLLDESASGSDDSGSGGSGWEDVGMVVGTQGTSSLSLSVGEVIAEGIISRAAVVSSSTESSDTPQTAGDAYERDYYSFSTFVNYSEVYSTFFSCLTSESTRLNVSLDENFWLPYVYQTFHPLPPAPDSTNLTSSNTNTSSSSTLHHNVNNNYYWWGGDVGGGGLGLGEGGEAIVGDIMERCLALISRLAIPRPYLLAWWQQFLWTLVFGAMMAMAVGGNMLVMWIIWGE
ncbi:hypothetical protein Pcinc_032799 [Petrolisthes cinctipes]|uniref:Uncharacterized protein n=1 Tax=Petrolisthes cinctipes TaxID=88211 RepID=A0AAE1JYK0_PETCI|nr:hypothetical protein Pcinc_032799 [Petrolisthes cinctipes]